MFSITVGLSLSVSSLMKVKVFKGVTCVSVKMSDLTCSVYINLDSIYVQFCKLETGL